MSTLYRTHKNLPASSKIYSLYVFDALSRAARSNATKRKLPIDMYADKGNSARFLVKVEGVLDGLFQDILSSDIPEAKVGLFSHDNLLPAPFPLWGLHVRFIHYPLQGQRKAPPTKGRY